MPASPWQYYLLFFFRLPIPLGGYIGPFGEIGVYDFGTVELFKTVILAWIFYGMFGGFIILSVFGVITGEIASRKYSDSVISSYMKHGITT